MPNTSEEYPRLCHYTTFEGLQGILQTQTLWATHYRFLNDYSELVLMKDRLVDFLVPIVKEHFKRGIAKWPEARKVIDQDGGMDISARKYATKMIEIAYKETGGEFYIVSFCGEHEDDYLNSNGLLSQWRSYGIGGGIVVVFNTRKLEEILEIETGKYEYASLHISDVIYSDDEEKFKKELYPHVAEFINFTESGLRNMELGIQEPPEGTGAFHSFGQCISRYKHRSFKEENEVRIVCLPTAHNEENIRLAGNEGLVLKPEKERKFRTRNGRLTPYIELFESKDVSLPIERIIVGPHKDKESRATALRIMLRNTEIEITISDIPYVD